MYSLLILSRFTSAIGAHGLPVEGVVPDLGSVVKLGRWGPVVPGVQHNLQQRKAVMEQIAGETFMPGQHNLQQQKALMEQYCRQSLHPKGEGCPH